MKAYRENYIRRAEIAQLILLHRLYAQKGSRDLIFQGGTALRWCYGGSRFSEDLDFVTVLDPQGVRKILQAAVRDAEKLMVPHFGEGEVTLDEKKSRLYTMKCFVNFLTRGVREKISVKLEFEGLMAGKLPEVQNHVLSSLGPVAYLMAAGEFRVPRPNTVLVAETLSEILSDKIRALLERPYLKGRDFFDVWYLYVVLKVPPDLNIVERKFTLYRNPFCARRSFEFFVKPSKQNQKQMREAFEQDLSRFLPPEVLDVHRSQKYRSFLEAVNALFNELKAKKIRLP